MSSHKESSVSEVFFGAVYGLGLSVAIWTLARAPELLRPEPLAFALLGLFCALSRHRLLRGLRWFRSLAPVLAATVLFGSAAAMWTAILAALAGAALAPRDRPAGHLRRPIFEIGTAALAVGAASAIYLQLGGAPRGSLRTDLVPALVGFALTFAIVESGLRRLAWLVECGGSSSAWPGRRGLHTLLGYTGSALVAPLIVAAYRVPPLRVALFAIPLAVLLYSLGRLHAERRARSRSSRRRESAIYRSITDALARALVTRNHDFADHLKRVRRLCLAVGRRLGLSEIELEALGAGALLHDVGKIAVPERILSEPRRLTVEEMDHVRVHPGVGAEIVEAIGYPYPVHPIVKHHHERWDGRGYPERLAAEEIPLGARILAAVDCFDALTTARPYRRAMTHDEALSHLITESGKMFDPQVVETLAGCLPRVESSARAGEHTESEPVTELPFAERELYAMNEIAVLARASVEIDETLTLIAGKIGALVPYENLLLLQRERTDKRLKVRFALGRDASSLQHREILFREPLRRLSSREIETELCERMGDGSSGLRAALATPIRRNGRMIGTLALFDLEGRRFEDRERRALESVAEQIAGLLEAARADTERRFCNLTDPATGLPNARFLRLEAGYRISVGESRTAGFGLLVFELGRRKQNLERRALERLLASIARRLACTCRPGETLVRFGQEQFLVLSETERSGELVRRYRDIVDAVEREAIDLGAGAVCAARLSAAHAAYPTDGADLDTLLIRLGARLALVRDGTRSILPFPAAKSAV